MSPTVAAAQNTDPVVVAHLERSFLLIVSADQAKAGIAVDPLAHLLESTVREVLSLALYVLWLLTYVPSCSADLIVGLDVTPSLL